MQWLNRNRKPLHPKPIAFTATKDDVEVDLALQYEDGYNENTFTFVNNINTHEGGTHLTGFKSALTRTINDVAKRRDFLKKEDFTLSGEDIREGLTCVLHVKVREPQFEGQTKTKLGNSEVEGIVKAVVNEHLGNYLEEHPPVARNIIEKAVSAARAREAARKARDLVRKKSRPRERGAARASWPTARSTTRPTPRSTWSRATRPAAAPSRGGTARSRPSCRSAARSSTSSGPGSTRSSATKRSGR